jgi:SAM-dependent methyltransferase
VLNDLNIRAVQRGHRKGKIIAMRSAKKWCLLLVLLGLNLSFALAQEKKLREPDVVFVPTPQSVVEQMMKLANVQKGDVLYDLGCGDGRTVITASKLGARAIGIDINPERIKESLANAKEAGVADRVTFRNEDLFEANFRDATVVTLYLLPSLNVKLRPKLWKELKPGTRIVSHDFDMGQWEPEKRIDTVEGHTLFLWTVPAKPPVLND